MVSEPLWSACAPCGQVGSGKSRSSTHPGPEGLECPKPRMPGLRRTGVQHGTPSDRPQTDAEHRMNMPGVSLAILLNGRHRENVR